ncbi:MAG: hypothetical protein IPK50_22080 [Fibrobacterota bacterium]|nr:MAG: hypothetical protein IPK50_22080 [Fibrobacterota bacterium]
MNRILGSLASALFLCLAARSHAAFDCPLIEGKEGGDRIPLIFYAVGYTQSERASYEADVQAALDLLWMHVPYRQFRHRFSVYRAWTPSLRSGLSDQSDDSTFLRAVERGGYPRTEAGFVVFRGDTNYACKGRDQAFVIYNAGIALVNADLPGAVTYDRRLSVVPRNLHALLHEFGHAIGFLVDEYETGGGSGSISPFNNVSLTTNRDSIPWKAWIDDSIPIPTPATAKYADVVGVFEGAGYVSTGRYRSEQQCQMRTGGFGVYCRVCTQVLVSSILGWTGDGAGHQVAVDNVWPPATWVASQPSILTGGNVFVHRFSQDSLPVSLRWRFLGNWLPDVRETLDVASLPGDGVLEAVLEANSPFIRDPVKIPRDTLRWTVRKAAGTQARFGRLDGIRRMGPAMFMVPHGVPVPQWARSANGKRVPLKVVARTADGWLLGGTYGFAVLSLPDPSDVKTESDGGLR